MVRRVFVDTSALIALLDADDPRQPEVRDAFVEHADDELVTHGYIVAETIAVARRRLGTDSVIALVDDVLPAIEVLAVGTDLHGEALRRYRRSLPSGTSFVDQVSLVIMEESKTERVLALDPDLERPGVTLVP